MKKIIKKSSTEAKPMNKIRLEMGECPECGNINAPFTLCRCIKCGCEWENKHGGDN